MTAGARRLALAAALMLQGTLAPARAQTTTPNLFLSSPPRSHVLAELELSGSWPRAFISANGTAEKFPGSIGFGLGVLRVSWAPLSHVAVGVEAPYRAYRFSPDGFTEASTGSGSPGAGVFADWAPSREGAPLAFETRAGAFFARESHGLPLSVSDGLNRYSLAAQLTTPASGGLVTGVRAEIVVRFEYGPTPRSEDTWSEVQVFVRAGPRLMRLGTADLYLLGVGGYRSAGAGREEANLFHDGHADNVVAGALLDAVWARPSGRLPRSFSFSVTRQIGRSNALDGWRATLTLREGI